MRRDFMLIVGSAAMGATEGLSTLDTTLYSVVDVVLFGGREVDLQTACVLITVHSTDTLIEMHIPLRSVHQNQVQRAESATG